MFQNYLKTITRILKRNKLFSLVNVFSLSTALIAVFIISIFIENELSYDRFHSDYQRIYRMSLEMNIAGRSRISPITMDRLGPVITEEMPEVDSFTRFTYPFSRIVQWKDKTVNFEKVLFADSTFFTFFDFQTIRGSGTNILGIPYSAVLTRSSSNKLFGNSNPVNKTIYLNGVTPLTVTGVIEDFPVNSHIDGDMVVSLSTQFKEGTFVENNWTGGFNYYTYVKLTGPEALESLMSKTDEFLDRHLNHRFGEMDISTKLYFDRISDIHLYSTVSPEIKPAGVIYDLYMFAAIAVIVLIIAGSNYVILSNAQSAKRAKEIGIRKTAGATRRELIVQFTGEAIILIVLSLALALIGLYYTGHYVEPYFNIQITVSSLFNPGLFISLIIILLLVSISAGFYSAYYLTKIDISDIFRKNLFVSTKKLSGRNLLLILQFSFSGLIIFTAISVFQQYRYMLTKPTGFSTDNRLVISLPNQQVRDRVEIIKSELEGITGVLGVSSMSSIPFQGVTSNGYIPAGETDPVMLNQIDADQHFLEVLNLTLVVGENFPESVDQSATSCIINETAFRMLGWDDPLKGTLVRDGTRYRVIGVVEDFNVNSLHYGVEPLILRRGSNLDHYDLVVHLAPGDNAGILARIETNWIAVTGNSPFFYNYFDDLIRGQYSSEMELFNLFFVFSLIAIALSLAGLLSLVAYTLVRKMKEIGLRKVFGASTFDIIKKMYKLFGYQLLVGVLAAFIIGSVVINRWLLSFPYKMAISPTIYLITALLVFILPLLAIYIQIRKAAGISPVEVLKSE